MSMAVFLTGRPMRIAQIAPLAETVPPRAYGGTERVVAWLTDALVELGCEVVLFASEGSSCAGELVPCAPGSLREMGVRDHTPWTLRMLERVKAREREFDILHFHVDLLHYPMFSGNPCALTTLHGRLDIPENHPTYRAFEHMPMVSISQSQRRPMPPVNWVATIHHGMPANLVSYSPKGGAYLVFLGRISPEKRLDRAIETAIRAGVPLKVAAKIDPADEAYFESEIVPLLGGPLIEFLGEIGDSEKNELLGRARALLFPVDWPEPFGLVAIEAMAAGTPVIGWTCGALPELIEPGVTGFLVDSIDGAVASANAVLELDRATVRRRFETRFLAERMAREYGAVYRRLLDGADHLTRDTGIGATLVAGQGRRALL